MDFTEVNTADERSQDYQFQQGFSMPVLGTADSGFTLPNAVLLANVGIDLAKNMLQIGSQHVEQAGCNNRLYWS